MDPLEKGYDLVFTDQIPDDMKCGACRLVLRDPLQIMTCGHRFCKTCFDHLRKESSKRNDILVCPVDGKSIALDAVFPDTGISRSVGNLKVRCSNPGCEWTDDLRHLENHLLTCQRKKIEQNDQNNNNVKSLLHEMSTRLEICEKALASKDNSATNRLNTLIEELKADALIKDGEIIALTRSNEKYQNDLKNAQKNMAKMNQRLERSVSEKETLVKKIEAHETDMKTMNTMLTSSENKDKAKLASLQKSLKESNEKLIRIATMDKQKESELEKKVEILRREMSTRLTMVGEGIITKMDSCKETIKALNGRMNRIDATQRDEDIKELRTSTDAMQDAINGLLKANNQLKDRIASFSLSAVVGEESPDKSKTIHYSVCDMCGIDM